ncbi:MAG: RluA family pseudouridine synthase [Actinomycetota bacterium]|jgi:23S rRNA pseudouridine1911/1915/1917 synthase
MPASVTIPESLGGERVDRVVAMLCDVTRAEAASLVAAGAVALDGRAVATRSSRVAGGQVLDVEVDRSFRHPEAVEADPSVEVPVVAVDDAFVVVDKPPGLVVHPGAGHRTGTMVQGLLARFGELAGVGQPGRPGVVHRLDAGTSGLLVVARTPEAYRSLVDQLAARTVERCYLALVWGTVEARSGVVDAPIGRSAADPTQMAVVSGGRPARTRYEVVQRYTSPVAATLVDCRLETGRTHQVRVHLAAIGHPVVGDERYGGRRSSLPAARPFLHAYRLAFDHPVDGRPCSFESPLPADLEEVRGLLA